MRINNNNKWRLINSSDWGLENERKSYCGSILIKIRSKDINKYMALFYDHLWIRDKGPYKSIFVHGEGIKYFYDNFLNRRGRIVKYLCAIRGI